MYARSACPCALARFAVRFADTWRIAFGLLVNPVRFIAPSFPFALTMQCCAGRRIPE
jgi:hypothetical protein